MWYDNAMNKRVSYYVSRKNLLVWLAAAALVCSAIIRIAYFCGEGADTKTVWLQTVLPVAACLIYTLIVLLDGKEHLYRTAVPVFLFAIYFSIRSFDAAVWLRFSLLCCLAYFVIAVIYTVVLSGKAHPWLVLITLAAALAALGYENRAVFIGGEREEILAVLPDALVLVGGLLTALAMQMHLDNRYHPTWGDRSDGRKLRTLDPMQRVGNYLMPNRNGASNNIVDTVEITAMERYIREKRKAGLTGFGINHVFLAAYVRCVAKYPQVNRFISGQEVFSRDDEIQFCMVVKEEMSTTAAESIMKLHLKPTDTVEDIYRKLNDEVVRIKGASDSSDFDKTAKLLSLVPGLALKFVVLVLKFLDYFGLLPKFLLEVSPFHGSIFFTSMGSLGIPPIVHHLYDFGNLPVFCSFGCKYRKNEVEADGTVVQRKYLDYSFNTDERICDGFYFATVLKYMKKLLSHPERLDEPVTQVVRDVD